MFCFSPLNQKKRFLPNQEKKTLKLKNGGMILKKNDSIQVKHELNRPVKDLTPAVLEKRKTEPRHINTESKSDIWMN